MHLQKCSSWLRGSASVEELAAVGYETVLTFLIPTWPGGGAYSGGGGGGFKKSSWCKFLGTKTKIK